MKKKKKELMNLILLIKGVHLCILQARWVIIIFYFWKMFRTLCMWLPKVIIINSIKKIFRSYLTFPWLFKQRLGPFECPDVILLLPTMSILRDSRFLLRFDIFNLAVLVLVFTAYAYFLKTKVGQTLNEHCPDRFLQFGRNWMFINKFFIYLTCAYLRK